MTTETNSGTQSTKWCPVRKIWETAVTLGAMQKLEERDLPKEEGVAKEANENLHSRGNADFMLCVSIIFSEAWKSDFYPKAWVVERPDLMQFVERERKSLIPYRLSIGDDHSLDTYFYGFYRGDQLGYQEGFGNLWFIVMGDSSGFWYIPIDALENVKGYSF